MKKITIIRTPKEEVLTKDELDLLFEKYEKTLTLPVIEGLKRLAHGKELQLHEKLIKADSNVNHVLINKISRYIPPIIVTESELDSLKIEKITYVDIIAKYRIKCYNYKKETEYYTYTGEKIYVVGFYIPSFSHISTEISDH